MASPSSGTSGAGASPGVGGSQTGASSTRFIRMTRLADDVGSAATAPLAMTGGQFAAQTGEQGVNLRPIAPQGGAAAVAGLSSGVDFVLIEHSTSLYLGSRGFGIDPNLQKIVDEHYNMVLKRVADRFPPGDRKAVDTFTIFPNSKTYEYTTMDGELHEGSFTNWEPEDERIEFCNACNTMAWAGAQAKIAPDTSRNVRPDYISQKLINGCQFTSCPTKISESYTPHSGDAASRIINSLEQCNKIIDEIKARKADLVVNLPPARREDAKKRVEDVLNNYRNTYTRVKQQLDEVKPLLDAPNADKAQLEKRKKKLEQFLARIQNVDLVALSAAAAGRGTSTPNEQRVAASQIAETIAANALPQYTLFQKVAPISWTWVSSGRAERDLPFQVYAAQVGAMAIDDPSARSQYLRDCRSQIISGLEKAKECGHREAESFFNSMYPNGIDYPDTLEARLFLADQQLAAKRCATDLETALEPEDRAPILTAFEQGIWKADPTIAQPVGARAPHPLPNPGRGA